jgi:hypothetical protein
VVVAEEGRTADDAQWGLSVAFGQLIGKTDAIVNYKYLTMA